MKRLLPLALLSLVIVIGIGGCSSIDDDYKTEGKLNLGTAVASWVLDNGRDTTNSTPRVTITISVLPGEKPVRVLIKNWESRTEGLVDVTVSDIAPMRLSTKVSEGKFTLCTVDAAGYPIDQFDVNLSKE